MSITICVLVAEETESAGLEAVQKAEGLEWIWSYLTSDDLHWSRSGNDY
jgi:hypothetical protein